MVVSMYKFRNFCRYGAAGLFLIAPFLAMPLAFARLGGQPVALFGLVKSVTLPVLTLLSLGIIAAFPEDLPRLWRNTKLKVLLITAGAYLLTISWQLAVSRITFEEFLGGGFPVVSPLAAAALSRELRRMLPYFAGIGALLLFWSGCTSGNFTGLLGNWNWTCGLLVALLPGIFLAGQYRYRQYFSLAALLLFFAAYACFAPENFPRSAMLAVLGAVTVFFLRDRMPVKYFDRTVLITGIIAAAAFFIWIGFSDIPDTRFQIWHGAFNSLLQNPVTGAGAGHFSENIRENLAETFFFTDFAAGHIDHAHNDLLNIFTECGIPGAVFYFTAVFILFAIRPKSDSGRLAKWMLIIMVICGCFDQHNLSVPGAFCLTLAAGILLMPENLPSHPAAVSCRFIPGSIAGAVFFCWAAGAAAVNWQSTVFIRRGDLRLLNGDTDGALAAYSDAMRQKNTLHALYQSAELYLLKQQPEKTLSLIRTMDEELHITNYRHTQRLKAVAAYQTGDLASAIDSLAREMRLAPYSLINAHFQYFLVRAAGMDEAVTADAYRHLSEMCRLRKIVPEDIPRTCTPEMDDAPFPPEYRLTTRQGKSIAAGIFMNLAGVLLLLLGSFGTGKFLLGKVEKSGALPACACGLTITGILSLYFPLPFVNCILAAAALPGAWFAAKIVKDNWKYALLFLLIFLPLLPALLLPPSAWDEQVYQIALIRKYLAAGSTAVRPDNPYSAYPSLGQLLTLPGCAIGGLNVPLLLIGCLNCFMAVKFIMTAGRYGRIPAALALGAILLSPLSCTVLRAFYVESFITFFGFAGVLLLLNNVSKRQYLPIIFAGAMAGAAAAVKLTGIGVSLMLFVLLLTDRDKRRYCRYFILAALLTALPFYLRVWIACGNPFYPYFSQLFHASASAVMVENFHRTLGSNYGMEAIAGIFFNWLIAPVDGTNYDGITLGCQFIVFFAVITAAMIKVRGKHPMLFRSVLVLLCGWLFWNLTAQQTRFLHPLLWAAAFVTVYASGIFTVRIRQIIMPVLAAATLITLYVEMAQFKHYLLAWRTVGEARKNPGHFAAWIHNEEAYAELIGQCEALKDHRIASLWERRTLYLPENVTILTPGFQEKLTPVPENCTLLYEVLRDFDYLIIRQPYTDVNKAVEFVPDATRLNELILELLRTGKLEPFRWTSDGQLSILRIVPEV